MFHLLSLVYLVILYKILYDILEDFETHHHIFAFFLQTVYVIEKLLTGLNVLPGFGMNSSLFKCTIT